jgi:hypothetical protein
VRPSARGYDAIVQQVCSIVIRLVLMGIGPVVGWNVEPSWDFFLE